MRDTMVRMVTMAAIGASSLLGLVAAFQIALALGAPWGQAAWGGTRAGVLPPRLRVASSFSALVLLVAAGTVLVQAGVVGSTPPATLRWGVWTLSVFLFLNTFGNFVSESRLEKWIMGPVALLTAGLCTFVEWMT